jgi:hypothetical protein
MVKKRRASRCNERGESWTGGQPRRGTASFAWCAALSNPHAECKEVGAWCDGGARRAAAGDWLRKVYAGDGWHSGSVLREKYICLLKNSYGEKC